MMRRVLIFFCLGLMLLPAAAQARRFRSLAPIATPEKEAAPQLPAGDTDPGLPAVDQALVEKAVSILAARWNQPDFADSLDQGFADRAQLSRTLGEVLPADARLNVRGVSGVRVLQSSITDRGAKVARQSVVEATVDTEIAFADAVAGTVRLRGQQMLLLRIDEAFEALP